jgi:HAD superfamily hydrolase (TIGR01509 family)
MKASTIIFDVDGVLLESNTFLAELHQKTAKELGLRVPTMHEILRLFGKEWSTIIQTLWPGIDSENFKKTYSRVGNLENVVIPPIKNAVETTKKLKNSGFKLAIVSARPGVYVVEPLKKSGFDLELFDVVISADDTKNHKPHPEPLIHACRRLNINPKEAVYVGDSLLDYESAKSANLEFIAVLTGDVKEEEFRENGVKNIIPSVAELPKFLKL